MNQKGTISIGLKGLYNIRIKHLATAGHWIFDDCIFRTI